MNCMNCGALLTDMDYCPHCGCDVMVQKKAFYLSNLYYNQGLEKASIRDLSGAIGCLRRSLTFNKYHMQARNLLGLVYFETGEVVSALSEWVISKNLNPIGNLAGEYIDKLQANPNKLNTISESIRKYNHALAYCREGHEDMAVIQLKKVLAQNPQLIKGYHLLALLQIKEKAYAKARRTLKKAARIDKTNTTTLRFLREIDEQTGVVTNLDRKQGREDEDGEGRPGRKLRFRSGNDTVIQPPAFRESSVAATVATFAAGIFIGAAALWFLIVPAKTQQIHQEANEQIQEYSDAIASKEAQLESLQSQAANNQAADKEQQTQQQAATALMNSYDALVSAYHAMDANERDQAVSYLAQVDREVLSESGKSMYDNVKSSQNITDDELANAPAPTAAKDEGQEGGDTGEGTEGDTGEGSDAGSGEGGYDDGSGDTGTGNEDSGNDGDDGSGEDNGYYDEEGNYVEY
ncbi:MAG: tetratricopeptide repeat protein [Blautia sp.]|jgi:hypothetical protein